MTHTQVYLTLSFVLLVMLCGFLERLAFNSEIDLESLSFLLVGLPCGAVLVPLHSSFRLLWMPMELVLMCFPRLPFAQAYPTSKPV